VNGQVVLRSGLCNHIPVTQRCRSICSTPIRDQRFQAPVALGAREGHV
jgi:hypothetical protein